VRRSGVRLARQHVDDEALHRHHVLGRFLGPRQLVRFVRGDFVLRRGERLLPGLRVPEHREHLHQQQQLDELLVVLLVGVAVGAAARVSVLQLLELEVRKHVPHRRQLRLTR
jgi:hypothetical protein